MDLTLEQIHEFNICPMIYKFKYIMGIQREGFYPLEDKYHESIRKTIMFYYYQILNGRQPTLEQLRQKFGSIFFKDKTPLDILGSSTFDSNYNALSAQGVKTINAFYNRESAKQFVPIMVDQDVRVPVKDHHLIMTIDLVREMKYTERSLTEVVMFTNTKKNVDTFYVNHNINLTAHAYAFRKLFETKENRLVIQHMKSSKEFFTVRKDHELRRFEAIVDCVADAITRDKFYPVHNIQCNRCVYRDVCDKYKF